MKYRKKPLCRFSDLTHNFNARRPVSLYVHIPFCIAKCIYCDFGSLSGREDLYRPYTNAVLREAKDAAAMLKGWKIDTIHFGGGTPSILSAELFTDFIENLYNTFDGIIEFSHTAPHMAPHMAPQMAPHTAPHMAPQMVPHTLPCAAPSTAPCTATSVAPCAAPFTAPCAATSVAPSTLPYTKDANNFASNTTDMPIYLIEAAIEANPGTLTTEKLSAYRKAGINRLSLGLQSTHNKHLEFLGRIHSFKEFDESVRMARKEGFQNINADLIFGFPGLTMREWKNTLDTVLEHELTHLSCYSMEVAEGTSLKRMIDAGKVSGTDEEIDREMYSYAIDRLHAAGFEQYEISNFAKPGFESRHNIAYWIMKDYIGLGAGAHSLFNGKRWGNTRNPQEFIERINSGETTVVEKTTLKKTDIASEYMFLGLRMTKGIDMDDFARLFGNDPDTYFDGAITKLKSQGLMSETGRFAALTRKGMDLANICMSMFVD